MNEERECRRKLLTGFLGNAGSVHMARTIMLAELNRLLEYLPDIDTPPASYQAAIIDDNCLGKRSLRTRCLSFRHLRQLYGLDPSVLVFRGLRYYWNRDAVGRPLLAFICAYARDPLLRMTAESVLGKSEGSAISWLDLAEVVSRGSRDRMRATTLKSTAQNLASSWTQSGHLAGRRDKVRARAIATPACAAYALFLGYLQGVRGTRLFETHYVRLLDSPTAVVDMAQQAARRGWLVFLRVGEVMEIRFPGLISAEEESMLDGQD